MTKSPGFDPAAYAPVSERVRLFWTAYPNGRITTRLVSRSERDVVFVACVYRSPDEAKPAATGWAAEREGDGEVNAVACLENTETSAVGRALANLGFTAARERPSLEEMERAARTRRQRAAVSARLQQRADAVSDVVVLLRAAEREGLRPLRAAALRARLTSGDPDAELLAKSASVLRSWLVKRREERRLFVSPARVSS